MLHRLPSSVSIYNLVSLYGNESKNSCYVYDFTGSKTINLNGFTTNIMLCLRKWTDSNFWVVVLAAFSLYIDSRCVSN